MAQPRDKISFYQTGNILIHINPIVELGENGTSHSNFMY